MRRRRKGLAAVGAGAFLASMVAVPAPAAATAPAALDWQECTDLDPAEGGVLECATLRVPLDHAAGAAAGTADIALSRAPATGERRGTLLVNPGGPGSPGRAWAAPTAAALPGDLREGYDVVGFDPRGTGASTPAVACDPAYFSPVRPDTVPRSRAEEGDLVRRAAEYAASCGANTGALLNHLTTADSAADLELLRAALGVERIDYLGYSYGSYLGAVYATFHPDRVRRLVLDSIVHPGRPWYESNLEQTRAVDAAARRFFDWIARHDDAYGLGATGGEVAGRYYAARDALRERPLSGTVGPTEFETAYLVATYAQAAWPQLARALSGYVTGDDPDALLRVYQAYGEDADSDGGFGAYLGTQCTDAPWPRDWSTWHTAAERLHREAPFVAWNNIWYNAPCATWPAPSRPWVEVDGSAVESALLIQATGDGPTPVDGAYAMRERFPAGRLLIEDGGGTHGVALGGNACVDTALAAYLRDGTLPPERTAAGGADATCAAAPEPAPEPEPDRRAER
ncbi:alpha/beta hydrolase [Nocardiopsis mangrovi]|uniref:Alpha/beta hydrolase n=1 Tax=Nocardiopsis mangrovi TaxID=1179818 RepID=A0ABV9E223_9ACTN